MNNDLKLHSNERQIWADGVPSPDSNAISTLEQSTNIRFRAPLTLGNFGTSVSWRSRASAAYVTGSHWFKVGMQLDMGERETKNHANQDIAYRFRNGIPNQLTMYAPNRLAPLVCLNAIWTLRAGFVDAAPLHLQRWRAYDYLNAESPAQSVEAGRFLPARSFEAVTNVPNWHDVVPRFAIAYDLFGDIRTAV